MKEPSTVQNAGFLHDEILNSESCNCWRAVGKCLNKRQKKKKRFNVCSIFPSPNLRKYFPNARAFKEESNLCSHKLI